MKNIQLPQIIKCKLLELEIGESGYIIMPIDSQSKLIKKGDKFYIGSKLCWDCEYYTEDYNDTDSWNFCSNNKSEYNYDAIDNIQNTTCNKIKPAQSLFRGECLSAEVVKMQDIKIVNYPRIFVEYNKIHNTNITPSMDDYVFLLEVRRNR